MTLAAPPSAAQGTSGAPGVNAGWTALRTPALCRSAPSAVNSPRLARGTHLAVERGDTDIGVAPAPAPILPWAVMATLVADESRREGWNLSLFPSSPPLLVRGPSASQTAAAAWIDELDAAARALDVEVSVWLVRDTGASANDASLPTTPPWASARLRSGVEGMFGERHEHAYVHNYSVEVATDAGVAAPVIGRALVGDVLHLRAMRARGGGAVLVEGLLDVAELASIDAFELSATDLGSVEIPRVRTLQIAFSGLSVSGAPLRIAWGGLGAKADAPSTPNADGARWPRAEGSLWIVARAQPDPAQGRWRVADTALLEATPWEWPAVSPGGALSVAERAPANEGLSQAVSTAILAKEAENDRGAIARPRSSWVAGGGALVGPRSEKDAWAAFDDLHAALENPLTDNAMLELRDGETFVRLPVAAGRGWRVLVGVESTSVADYDVEIAPETWMPGPRVERCFDGFCAQGVAAAASSTFNVWSARTTGRRVAERSSIPLGRLELSARQSRSFSGELRAGPAIQVLAPAPLTLGFSPRPK